MNHVIEAVGLHKKFGATSALRGMDLTVRRGTVHGLLGPNGAGKTTAVRILATLSRPDAGRAWIDGIDLLARPDLARQRLGLAGQHAAIDEKITGRESLRMFGRLHHIGERAARNRADERLAEFGLEAAADRLAGAYSGGMRRRLDIAASLLVAPAVLFLDEPTTGLDPRSRNEVWETIRTLVADGTSVLLTTQYLDEADQLASDISVIDTGQVIASGTPASLKSQIGGDRLEVVMAASVDLGPALSALSPIVGTQSEVDHVTRKISAAAAGGSRDLIHAVRALDDAGLVCEDIGLRRPTLDDVFLRLTGVAADDHEHEHDLKEAV